jgi:hypothetical protein
MPQKPRSQAGFLPFLRRLENRPRGPNGVQTFLKVLLRANRDATPWTRRRSEPGGRSQRCGATRVGAAGWGGLVPLASPLRHSSRVLRAGPRSLKHGSGGSGPGALGGSGRPGPSQTQSVRMPKRSATSSAVSRRSMVRRVRTRSYGSRYGIAPRAPGCFRLASVAFRRQLEHPVRVGGPRIPSLGGGTIGRWSGAGR